ncbi:MAG: sodium:proton antiporter [Clostridia bacterium]|nr:sodium:proton antiporter [Clostridia bacterium]MBR4458375.1 sodium:proton antiporter [Clostridia bacterium]
MTPESAWTFLLDAALVAIGILLLFCLWRAFRGPQVTDRIIAINVIGTMVVIVICILTLRLGEDYLTDVAMIYTLLSFLAVLALCKMYIGTWRKRQGARRKEDSTDA